MPPYSDPMPGNRLRRVLGLVCATSVLVAASACSDSKSNSSTGASNTTTTSSSGSTTPLPSIVGVLDLSWISASHGWALVTTADCLTDRCLALVTTVDSGKTWSRVDRSSPLSGVSRVRFVNANDGYAFAPGFMTTNDGGVSWHSQAGPMVGALEGNGRDVIRLSYDHDGCPGPCDWLAERATPGSRTWTKLPMPVPKSQGVHAQLVRDGRNHVYALFMGNAAGGGDAIADLLASHDDGATWQSHGEPCPTHEQDHPVLTSAIAAAGRGVLAALCFSRVQDGSPDSVVVSSDGGATFGPERLLPSDGFGQLAVTSAKDIVVASRPVSGSGPHTYNVVVSHDGGDGWKTAVTDTQQISASTTGQGYLGFESNSVGRWVGFPSTIWTTTDGGDHWTPRGMDAGHVGAIAEPLLRVVRRDDSHLVVMYRLPMCDVPAGHDVRFGPTEVTLTMLSRSRGLPQCRGGVTRGQSTIELEEPLHGRQIIDGACEPGQPLVHSSNCASGFTSA